MSQNNVKLPCFAGYTQFALWPAPNSVSVNTCVFQYYIKKQWICFNCFISLLECFILWTIRCWLHLVPNQHWRLDRSSILSWLPVCSLQGYAGKPWPGSYLKYSMTHSSVSTFQLIGANCNNVSS